MTKTYMGIYYFESAAKARAWAEENGWPTDRIIQYGRGFAIQSSPSGNYAGPDTLKPKPWKGTAGD